MKYIHMLNNIVSNCSFTVISNDSQLGVVVLVILATREDEVEDCQVQVQTWKFRPCNSKIEKGPTTWQWQRWHARGPALQRHAEDHADDAEMCSKIPPASPESLFCVHLQNMGVSMPRRAPADSQKDSKSSLDNLAPRTNTAGHPLMGSFVAYSLNRQPLSDMNGKPRRPKTQTYN